MALSPAQEPSKPLTCENIKQTAMINSAYESVDTAYVKCLTDRINWFLEENINIVDSKIIDGKRVNTAIVFDKGWLKKDLIECGQRKIEAHEVLNEIFLANPSKD